MRRFSSIKHPDNRNPCPHTHTHTMILERHKQHRHNAPPPRINPFLYNDEYTNIPGANSSLSHSSTLSQAQNLPRDQGQAAASRGRRRETPGDPRPSACGSTTHLGYFGGARYDETFNVRPLLRAARANAVRKLLADDGEQSENGRVPPRRRSRATHRQGHAASRTH